MIKRLVIPIICAALLIGGCAQFQNVQQAIGTPQQVQADITVLAGIAKPHITADAQAKIHWFAMQLNEVSNLDLNVLYALLPNVTDPNVAALIGAAKAYLAAVVQKWGTNNGTSLAYAHAVANGLLTNF